MCSRDYLSLEDPRGVPTVSQASPFGGGTRSSRLSRFASTTVSESGRAVGCACRCLYGRGWAGRRRFTCVWSVNIGLSSGPCGGRWPRRSTRATSLGCPTNWCAQAGRSCHVPEALRRPPLLSRGFRCTRGRRAARGAAAVAPGIPHHPSTETCCRQRRREPHDAARRRILTSNDTPTIPLWRRSETPDQPRSANLPSPALPQRPHRVPKPTLYNV